MGKVRTVLGDIESSELGFTYSHEHLWTDPPAIQKDRDLELTVTGIDPGDLATFRRRNRSFPRPLVSSEGASGDLWSRADVDEWARSRNA